MRAKGGEAAVLTGDCSHGLRVVLLILGLVQSALPLLLEYPLRLTSVVWFGGNAGIPL